MSSASDPEEIVLWTWDTPNDLRFLNPHQASIATYEGTIVLRGESILYKPYQKHLSLPASVASFPVIRIETTGKAPDTKAIDALVQMIGAVQKNYPRSTNKIQIDFDATISERPFYKALLQTLRKQGLRPDTTLSVTALATWCLNDRWLSHSECDEAVAMLFSMGPGKNSTYTMLKKSQGRLSAGKGVQTTVAISANEPSTNAALKNLGVFSGIKKLYIFDSLPWRLDTFTKTTGQTFASHI